MSPVTAHSPWIEYVPRVERAHAVLVCCPHAGGAASTYRSWATQLAEIGVEVWPVQLPGREGRFSEPFAEDVDAVADEIVDRLATGLDGRTFGVYGHSAGSYLAWRIALRAQQRVGAPSHLFVGASRPPADPDPDFPIHQLDPDAFLGRLVQYGRIPDELLRYAELVELTTRTARADLRLVEVGAWLDAPPLHCPVTAFGGVRDAAVPVASLDGWRHITEGPFTSVPLPGGHFPPPSAEAQILEAVRRALG